jgi:uncharacterized DUF497 family protein
MVRPIDPNGAERRRDEAALPDHWPVQPHRSCICWLYTGLVADPLESCIGFDWDEANRQKNWERHRVTPEEAEDVFFQEPLVVRSDLAHSKAERRYYALGQTAGGRWLFVAFTVRRRLIRVISVRDMNRNETEIYRNYEKEGDS